MSHSSLNSRKGRAPALCALLCALAAARAPAAAVRLDVGGAVEPSSGGLMVRLDVSNHGDLPAPRLDVEGELSGQYAESSLPAGIRAGASQSLWLHFPAPPPRPGVHAVALHLRYPVPGARDSASQRAYLLLALGARADPPVRVSAAPASFETAGALEVRLESADGAAHAVRVRVLPPRGLNALEEPEVTVPAAGGAVARVPLIRSGPSRSERHEVIVLAAATTDGVDSTAVARAWVELVPHVPVLPRARIPLAVLGALLLAAAVAAELWRRYRV